MAEMSKQTYLDHISADGGALLAVLDGDSSLPVPSCPEWTVADLVIHCGRVWGYMAQAAANPSTEAPQAFPDAPQDGADLRAWAQGQLDELLDSLEQLDVAQNVWTFGSDSTAAFYPRRLAHETAVHRWDAQNAAGTPDPIDADLATDGVDECFDIGIGRKIAGMDAADLPAGSLHLHRTDGEGEWMARIEGGALVVTQEHGKGDAAVRGAASDLVLYCWGRGQADSLEIFGDQSVVDAWGSLSA